MSWIKVIKIDEAKGQLKRLYKKVAGPNNKIDNILTIHSLRPHSLVGHMALYKNVLHNANNTLPKWYLETVGVYVSYLNQCHYCVAHHFEGLKRLFNDELQANLIYTGIQNNNFENCLEDKLIKGLAYAKQLTVTPTKINEEIIINLRALGFTDGEVLELNQVVSYFNYVNRTVLGLGVNLDGDILGLSPNNSADPDNWSHS